MAERYAFNCECFAYLCPFAILGETTTERHTDDTPATLVIMKRDKNIEKMKRIADRRSE